jgi:hypothetical protein
MSNLYKNSDTQTAILQEENLELLRELRSLYELHVSLLREAVSLQEAIGESGPQNLSDGTAQ